VLRDKRFWAGVIVGYLLLVFLPQLNVRTMAVKKAA
jgi:hypothetical protein